MPRVIYKYELGETDLQDVMLSAGYKILSVQEQKRKGLVMWVEEEIKTLKAVRVTIAIYGTGNPIPDENMDRVYIGTVQMSHGLVWHVFQVK